MVVNTPSQILDIDGSVIAEIGSERNRKNVKYNDIPQNLKNAYVSIEDERFYKHFGIDMKIVYQEKSKSGQKLLN